jgi:hypothetical protein
VEMQTVLGRLVSLTLENQAYNGSDDEIVPNVMRMLGNLCSNLGHLDLKVYSSTGEYGIYKDDLDVLLFGLKNSLVSLSLGYFNDECRHEVKVEHSPFVHCSLLEKLSLTRGLNAEDIMAIGRLENLKELVIGDRYLGNHITDENFKDAFEQRKLNRLQQLKLTGFKNLGKKATGQDWARCYAIGQIKGLYEAVTECGPLAITLQILDIESCPLNRNVIMSVTSL